MIHAEVKIFNYGGLLNSSNFVKLKRLPGIGHIIKLNWQPHPKKPPEQTILQVVRVEHDLINDKLIIITKYADE